MQVPGGAEQVAKQDTPSAAGAALQQNAAQQHSAGQASGGAGTRLEAHCHECLPGRYSDPTLQAGTRHFETAGGMMLNVLTRAFSNIALDLPNPHNSKESSVGAAACCHKAALAP